MQIAAVCSNVFIVPIIPLPVEGPDNVNCIASRYGLDGSGLERPWIGGIFCFSRKPRLTPGAYPASCKKVTGPHFWGNIEERWTSRLGVGRGARTACVNKAALCLGLGRPSEHSNEPSLCLKFGCHAECICLKAPTLIHLISLSLISATPFGALPHHHQGLCIFLLRYKRGCTSSILISRTAFVFFTDSLFLYNYAATSLFIIT
jgi:hypothetical protein